MDLFTEYAFRLSSNTALTATDKLIEKLLALRALMNYEDQYDEALPAIFSLLVQMGLLGEAYGLSKKLPDQNMQLCKNLFDFIQRPPCKSLAVTFEIITRCNLRCPMCAHGIPERYHKLNQTMSLENFKKAWDNIKNYTGSVVLVGIGETFLHPHIYDIIEYMADTPVIIDTNGNVPLNMDRILGSGVDELVFSVDGIDQDTYSKYRVGGSFDKVVANIKAVLAARQARNLKKPEVVFKYVIFRHNEVYLDQARQLAQSLGADRFRPESCMATIYDSREQLNKLMGCGPNATKFQRVSYVDYGQQRVVPHDIRNSPHCAHVFNNFTVQVDGAVQPCCVMLNSNDQFGNVFNDNFQDIWYSAPYTRFRERVLADNYAEPGCRQCTMEKSHLGKIFKNTILEYAKLPPPSHDIVRMADLRLDSAYVNELISQEKWLELEYFNKTN